MHVLRNNKLGAFALLLSDSLKDTTGELSPSAAALLLTLFYGRDTTVTELAKVCGVSQPTAVRVLDGLARRGLIERMGRAGRTTLLGLTPPGQKKARLLQAARLNAMNDVLRILPRQERAAFERTLDKLLRAATHTRAFARTTCRLCDHAHCDGPLCPIGTRAAEIERAAHPKSRSSETC
jgi:DNA-binding MarR family transcriptional regulator